MDEKKLEKAIHMADRIKTLKREISQSNWALQEYDRKDKKTYGVFTICTGDPLVNIPTEAAISLLTKVKKIYSEELEKLLTEFEKL